MKKMNNKGFTLAELLIVVAIIAVLVAIAIPVFTAQLEEAREATDAANIRSKYAEVMACALTGEEDTVNGITVTTSDGEITVQGSVDAEQKQADWQGTDYSKDATIGGVNVTATTTGWTVKYTESDGKVAIDVKS